jgi:hypothetical protein
MGQKLVLLAFVIVLCVVALSLPQPILIASAVLAIIGVVLLFMDK